MPFKKMLKTSLVTQHIKAVQQPSLHQCMQAIIGQERDVLCNNSIDVPRSESTKDVRVSLHIENYSVAKRPSMSQLQKRMMAASLNALPICCRFFASTKPDKLKLLSTAADVTGYHT